MFYNMFLGIEIMQNRNETLQMETEDVECSFYSEK